MLSTNRGHKLHNQIWKRTIQVPAESFGPWPLLASAAASGVPSGPSLVASASGGKTHRFKRPANHHWQPPTFKIIKWHLPSQRGFFVVASQFLLGCDLRFSKLSSNIYFLYRAFRGLLDLVSAGCFCPISAELARKKSKASSRFWDKSDASCRRLADWMEPHWATSNKLRYQILLHLAGLSDLICRKGNSKMTRWSNHRATSSPWPSSFEQAWLSQKNHGIARFGCFQK